MNRIGLALLTLGFAFAASACGGPQYERTGITDVSQGDLPGTVSLSVISIPVGGATRAIVRPYNDDGKQMGGTVESDNSTVLEVAPGLEDGEYIFMARTKGKTTVRFLADGAVVAIANAEVTEQSGSR